MKAAAAMVMRSRLPADALHWLVLPVGTALERGDEVLLKRAGERRWGDPQQWFTVGDPSGAVVRPGMIVRRRVAS